MSPYLINQGHMSPLGTGYTFTINQSINQTNKRNKQEGYRMVLKNNESRQIFGELSLKISASQTRVSESRARKQESGSRNLVF